LDFVEAALDAHQKTEANELISQKRLDKELKR
jgi:hypothetical protein